jgi:uncharacterized protein YeaO (DUF488 family)
MTAGPQPPGAGGVARAQGVMARVIQVRRVYDEISSDDGVRVLVDRVWPRGLRKDEAELDEWVKDVAPSTDLRKWYGHDPDKFTEFRRRYCSELDTPSGRQALQHLRTLPGGKALTLLTATKDMRHSHASVLVELLRSPP